MNCPNCNSSWNDSIAINLTKCPLCQHDLTKTANTVDTDSPEGILQGIVKQFTPEIYNESIKFKSILSDYFANDKKLLKALKIIIDYNGASDIYKNSNLDGNQFDLKVRTILLRVSDDSWVAQDMLIDGAVLLCKGLGKDFAYTNQQTKSTQPKPAQPKSIQPKPAQLKPAQLKSIQPKPAQPKLAQPKSIQLKSNTKQPSSDFLIENGELVKYLGSGSDVIIPNSVTSIGDSAFFYCKSLTNITIPNSVSSIGEMAFRNCISLTNITIPDSVSSIGNHAFWSCKSLANITIPNSVSSIGDLAFFSCTSLKTVKLPSQLRYYAPAVFPSCHPNLQIIKY